MAQADRVRLRREPNGRAYVALRSQIIAARKLAGLTQQTVADRLGRHQSFIAKLETGERTLDVVELVALARVISLDLSATISAIEAQL